MMIITRILLVLAGCAFALRVFASDAPSEIHACKDAKGEVVYQDEPCSEPVKRKVAPAIRAPARVSAPPRAPAPAPKAVTPPFDASRVDARWASPERTLRTFVGAVKSGDRALAVACLTSSALAELGPDVGSPRWETLRRTVDAFTGFVSEGDLGPFWSIRALRAGIRPKWIFFERGGDGTWRISAI